MRNNPYEEQFDRWTLIIDITEYKDQYALIKCLNKYKRFKRFCFMKGKTILETMKMLQSFSQNVAMFTFSKDEQPELVFDNIEAVLLNAPNCKNLDFADVKGKSLIISSDVLYDVCSNVALRRRYDFKRITTKLKEAESVKLVVKKECKNIIEDLKGTNIEVIKLDNNFTISSVDMCAGKLFKKKVLNL